jgi:hypothetical protein
MATWEPEGRQDAVSMIVDMHMPQQEHKYEFHYVTVEPRRDKSELRDWC